MPTAANLELPRPKDWNEFEDICLSISKIKWSNPNFSRFGRIGQKQDGVDIYGDGQLGQLIGVQCKNTLVNNLTIEIINKEINNAELFTPPIAEMYIATSAVRDVNIQREVAALSQSRIVNGKFGVGLIFWADIEQELSKNMGEVERFYPQFFKSSINPQSQPDLRARDISSLTNFLNYIDIEPIQYYLELSPKFFPYNFLKNLELLKNLYYSPLFNLYDLDLKAVLCSWINKWLEIEQNILHAPYQWLEHTNTWSFIMPMDFCRTPAENAMYENLQLLVSDFIHLQKDFCEFIHQRYPEIDLISTSRNARTILCNL